MDLLRLRRVLLLLGLRACTGMHAGLCAVAGLWKRLGLSEAFIWGYLGYRSNAEFEFGGRVYTIISFYLLLTVRLVYKKIVSLYNG